MNKHQAVITSLAHYVPPEVYKNSYFESFLDTSDEWIRTRTGIHERRFAFYGATSDLMLPAAEKCIKDRGIDKSEIDCVICATITPDHTFPSTACIVQDRLGLPNAWGFDVAAACSGFLFALETARRLVETGGARAVLVCSGDKMSSILNFQDRTTCVLFGDGAGAVLVEPSDDPEVGIMESVLHIDGDGKKYLYMPSGGSLRPPSEETVKNREHFVVQDGQTVFKSAVIGMANITVDVMKKAGITSDDVNWLAPHQANLRIIDATANRMGLDKDKVMINIERFGNTTAGTIPICLSEWHGNGKLAYGDGIILCSFGAGYTSGAIYLKWGIR